MKARAWFEIIGTIALLCTLFSSVGLSGWVYGSNLIQNGDFANYTIAEDNVTIIVSNWTLGRSTYYNATGGYVFINSSVSGEGGMVRNDIAVFSFTKGDAIRISVDVYPVNMTGELPPNNSNEYGYGLIFIVEGGNVLGNEIDFNSTAVVQMFTPPESLGFYSGKYFVNTQMTDIGGGWKSVSGDLMTGTIPELSAGAHEAFIYIGGWNPQSDASNYIFYIDNADVRGTDFDLNVSAVSPNEAVWSGKRAGVSFIYGIRSSVPADNCTLWIRQEIPYLSGNWGDWMALATAYSPNQNSTNSIPFRFVSGRDDQSYQWQMSCMSDGLRADSNAPVFTVMDSQKVRGMTFTILSLAPIIFSIFVVGTTFVWLMTHEGEETVSVMIHIGILYLVILVMLVIIYGIMR